MVTRLGFAPGTKRVLQVVTDGMKLAPNGPTLLQERDAIIMAASALPVAPQASADVADVREGFRRRGMGFSAVVNNAGTGANNTASPKHSISRMCRLLIRSRSATHRATMTDSRTG